jgi:hypothetical protein
MLPTAGSIEPFAEKNFSAGEIMKRSYAESGAITLLAALLAITWSGPARSREEKWAARTRVAALERFAFSDREPAEQYDAGDPTPEEQVVLERINRARRDPIAEGKRLKIDIKEGLSPKQQILVGPRPPLAMNKKLLAAARGHSEDMYQNNYFGHVDKEGKNVGERLHDVGYQWRAAGENIASQSNRSLRVLHDMLMIDTNVPGRGHRVNLLDLNESFTFREVGVGAYVSDVPNRSGIRAVLTEDFATSRAGPFFVGVVYKDRNNNQTYDAGEGLAGVQVMPDRGEFYAVTSRSGGFSIPCPRGGGKVKLTASGGDLNEPISRTVTLAGVNIKVDFVVKR